MCMWYWEPHGPRSVLQSNSPPHDVVLPKSTFIAKWLFPDQDDTSISKTWLSIFTSEMRFEHKILNVISPYFNPLKTCLRQLHQLIYGLSYNQYFKETRMHLTYEEMVKILWMAIRQLPLDQTTHYEPSASVKAQYPPMSQKGYGLAKRLWMEESTCCKLIHCNSLVMVYSGVARKTRCPQIHALILIQSLHSCGPESLTSHPPRFMQVPVCIIQTLAMPSSGPNVTTAMLNCSTVLIWGTCQVFRPYNATKLG